MRGQQGDLLALEFGQGLGVGFRRIREQGFALQQQGFALGFGVGVPGLGREAAGEG
jgi:hypothetical protein